MLPLGISSMLDLPGASHSLQERLCPDLPVALIYAHHDAAEPVAAVNSAAAAMLGYASIAELRVVPLSKIFVDADSYPSIVAELLVLSHRQSQRECELRRKDGSHVWASIQTRLQENADSRTPRFLLALADITASKLVQATLTRTQERFRSMSLELSITEERERRRLSGYLHDEVAQLISLARMKMSLLHAAPAGEGRDAEALQVQAVLDRAMTATRSLMFQLSHPAVNELGFTAGARWLTEDFTQLYGLKVELIHDQQQRSLDLRLTAVLFQCLRELLVNTAKHAHVPQVRVEIAVDDQKVSIAVIDRGFGCDIQRLEMDRATGGGFGLLSIRERIHGLGGTMELRSAPNQGTTVKLEVPFTCIQVEQCR